MNRLGQVGATPLWAMASKSRCGRFTRLPAAFGVAFSVALAAGGGIASAHGPVAPVATSYLAKVSGVPAGLDARVVDGYVRMWLRVPPTETVVVLDYRGAPYLRFSSSGVQVNHNSTMYYLNQTPVAETPPADLNRDTSPDWQSASAGHEYEWHDGRLQALASVALAPGATYVGRWSIPLVVNGSPTAITGRLWHANSPSIVWFWPIVVLIACVLAAWRLGNVELDRRLARVLGVAALLGIAAADVGLELHGRPSVSVEQYLEFAALAAFVVWGLYYALFRPPRFFGFFVIGLVALWAGLNLLPTLLNGFVLINLPAFVARAATVICLACGASIMWPIFRLAGQRDDAPANHEQTAAEDPDLAYESS